MYEEQVAYERFEIKILVLPLLSNLVPNLSCTSRIWIWLHILQNRLLALFKDH